MLVPRKFRKFRKFDPERAHAGGRHERHLMPSAALATLLPDPSF